MPENTEQQNQWYRARGGRTRNMEHSDAEPETQNIKTHNRDNK